MIYLILPDIHNKIAVAEQIITLAKEKHSVQHCICLGDYFDSFYDTVYDAENTARWVAQKLDDSFYTLCMGNHDTSYRWPVKHQFNCCAGFSISKSRAITPIVGDRWNKMKPYVRIGSFFFSHASISAQLIDECIHSGVINEFDAESPDGIDAALDKAFAKAHERFATGTHGYEALYAISYNRGGNYAIGGITWADLSEVIPIKNIYQVIGHTPIRTPVVIKHGDSADNYYPPAETVYTNRGVPLDKMECEASAQLGCIIGMDTHLESYAIFDSDANSIAFYSCDFDKKKSPDFDKKLLGTKHVYSFSKNNC